MNGRMAGGMVACAAASLLVIAARPALAEEGATYAALQSAYSREVNSQAQYIAFADCAVFESHPEVACLFLAAARAESVHAANHAIVIRQLQGTPVSTPEQFVVMGTADNLRASILNEQRERTTTYRLFADYARREDLYEALATFNYARGAEATHERMFRAALARLVENEPVEPLIALASYTPPSWQPALPHYFVCLGDGALFDASVSRCPLCGTSGGRIVEQACKR